MKKQVLINSTNFNLQRSILLREGWNGRKDDNLLDYFFVQPLRKGEIFFNDECLVSGKEGEAISKIGSVMDRQEFESMKSEYYELRGWDIESGLPTKAGLERLGLSDIAEDLDARNLIVSI